MAWRKFPFSTARKISAAQQQAVRRLGDVLFDAENKLIEMTTANYDLKDEYCGSMVNPRVSTSVFWPMPSERWLRCAKNPVKVRCRKSRNCCVSCCLYRCARKMSFRDADRICCRAFLTIVRAAEASGAMTGSMSVVPPKAAAVVALPRYSGLCQFLP